MQIKTFQVLGIASIAALASLTLQARADAATFTQTFDSFADGTIVSGPGIFSDFQLSAGASTIQVVSANPGPDFSSKSISKFPGFSGPDPYRADFLIAGIKQVGVTLGDFNADADDLFLRAFSSTNTLLGETLFSLPGSTSGGPTLSISSASDIAYVLFGNTSTVGFPNSVFADNFSYTTADTTAIPTPALLPGLIGLGFGVLRKRKAEAAKQTSEV